MLNNKIKHKITSLNLEGTFDIYYQIQPIYENHWDMYTKRIPSYKLLQI